VLSLDLYETLFLIRRVEQYIVKRYSENEMKCPMHMSMGQEAISVGVCYALQPSDQVFASYRNHAAFLARTKDTDRFFAEIYGRITGTAQGKSGSMHLLAIDKGFMGSSGIVGSCIPLAVGAAFANKYKQNNQIACTFFGDGALDEGVFWESLNVAGVMKLPVLFVVEDNGLAVDTPTCQRQAFKDLTSITRKFDCNSWYKDTTNVEVIYAMADRAVDTIIKTEKPSLLHFKCDRFLEHVGIHIQPGIPVGDDCVVQQREELLRLDFSESDIVAIEKRIDAQILESIAKARKAPLPDGDEELYRGVFFEDNLL
jgi:TPP-dependent pyruvate/acetoin dehydrogenase alpha subunit